MNWGLILPTISTSFIVLSAIVVAFGVVDIKNKRLDAHRVKMNWGAIFAIIFFVVYASRTIVGGNTTFGGPDWLKPYYFTFLIFHITLALTSAIMGITTLILAYRKSFVKHRKIGPWTAYAWWFTAITGVAVYLLLYVIYEPGEAKHVLDVITNK